MSETTDPKDPRLGHGADTEPVPQNEAYLVLSEEERARGFVRPVRRSYVHIGAPDLRIATGDVVLNGDGCGSVTTMSRALAETYAADPTFYGSTYCAKCRKHRPVGEFVWDVPPATVITDAVQHDRHLLFSPRVGS